MKEQDINRFDAWWDQHGKWAVPGRPANASDRHYARIAWQEVVNAPKPVKPKTRLEKIANAALSVSVIAFFALVLASLLAVGMNQNFVYLHRNDPIRIATDDGVRCYYMSQALSCVATQPNLEGESQ